MILQFFQNFFNFQFIFYLVIKLSLVIYILFIQIWYPYKSFIIINHFLNRHLFLYCLVLFLSYLLMANNILISNFNEFVNFGYWITNWRRLLNLQNYNSNYLKNDYFIIPLLIAIIHSIFKWYPPLFYFVWTHWFHFLIRW